MKHTPIRVDWDELEGAFSNQNDELVYYLDLVTGHIGLDGEGEEADFDDEEAHLVRSAPPPVRDDGTRAMVEPMTTDQKLGWMKSFLDTAEDLDEESVSALRDGMSADNPAETLGQVLRERAEARDRWYLYRAERLHEVIENWLTRHGVTPVDPPPWKS